jgi:hypothetical protein
LRRKLRFNARMPALTRRRSADHRHKCWHIYYGDVHVGTIAERIGNPHDTDPWEWSCGFYPGSHPREHKSDTAATFEDARADFERAWQVFFSNRTEADFQKWRDQRDWTERKYALSNISPQGHRRKRLHGFARSMAWRLQPLASIPHARSRGR